MTAPAADVPLSRTLKWGVPVLRVVCPWRDRSRVSGTEGRWTRLDVGSSTRDGIERRVYADHIFVVLHAPKVGRRGHVHYVELDQFIGRNFLVTVHGPLSPAVDPAVALLDTPRCSSASRKGGYTGSHRSTCRTPSSPRCVIECYQTRISTHTTIAAEKVAALSVRQNDDMRRITAWVAIAAVPTAVTGFFGQNVPYPGFGQPAGVVASVALIVALAVLLYIAFRRKRWL